MQGKNIPAIVLCGVAALFILVGIYSSSWATRKRGTRKLSVGTSEISYCRKGECRTQKFNPDRLRTRDKPMYLGGKAVFAWGVINVLLLLAVAVLLGLGHGSSHIPPRISLFTAMFSLLLGGVFLLLLMATVKGKPMMTPGFSFYIHNLGCIAGIIGSAMAWKKVAAVPGGMPGQPMPGQPMPDQAMPGQPMPGQPMPGQAMPGQPMPGQAMPGQPMPGQDPAVQAQAQAMPGQPMPGQPMPDQAMPGQPMPGQDPAVQAQAQAMAMAQAPAPCPTCGAAARWVPEFNRYYCDACQQYV
jgi:hypothetical protein